MRHPLVRSAIYGAATSARRRQAHRALADALAGTPDEDRRAWHLAASVDEPDEEVVTALDHAAERARRRGGHEAAAAAWSRAAELTLDPQARALRLYSAAGSSLMAARPAETDQLARAALMDATDPLLRADLLQLRGQVEWNTRSLDDGYRIVCEAAVTAAPHDPTRARVLAMLAASLAAFGAHSPDAPDPATIVDPPPPDAPAEDLVAALMLEGFSAVRTGDWPTAAAALRRAWETPLGPTAHPLLAPNLAIATMHLGDDARALPLHDLQLRHARDGERGQHDRARPHPRRRLPDRHRRLGRGRLGGTGGAAAGPQPRPGRAGGVPPGRAGPHHRPARRPGRDRATSGARGDHRPAPTAWCGRRARFRVDGTGPPPGKPTSRRPRHCTTSNRSSFRSCAAWPPWTGSRPQCVPSVETSPRTGCASCASSPKAPTPRGRGPRPTTAQAVLGGPDAEHHFAQALEWHARSPRIPDRARTQLALGEYLRRSRRRTDARVPLREALDTFETLGATFWAERARQELRASGETARRGADAATSQLTPQEAQVAAQVRQGLSNKDVAARLFVSPRTVDFHLRNIYSKLGITSRVPSCSLSRPTLPPAAPPEAA